MPKLLRSSAGRLSSRVGKPWGNALGGYKSQPRIAGRFATTSQVKAYSRLKRTQKIRMTVHKVTNSGRKQAKAVTASATGGVIAAAFVANKLNPSLSVSRKRVQASIRPDVKIGPFHAYTSHAIGIERRGDDAIDRTKDKVRRRASSEISKTLGDGVSSQVAHGLVGLPNYAKIEDSRLSVDGKVGNPRIRYSKASVPGAPASAKKAKSVGKPQGGRKTGAKTITNATKGSGGAVRPARRGGGKKKKKKAKR